MRLRVRDWLPSTPWCRAAWVGERPSCRSACRVPASVSSYMWSRFGAVGLRVSTDLSHPVARERAGERRCGLARCQAGVPSDRGSGVGASQATQQLPYPVGSDSIALPQSSGTLLTHSPDASTFPRARRSSSDRSVAGDAARTPLEPQSRLRRAGRQSG
jgi:hypothetical protein